MVYATWQVRQVLEFGSGSDGLAPPLDVSGVRVATQGARAQAARLAAAEGVEDEAGLWGVAADAQRVYVSDSRRHRLHAFKLRGGLL